MTWQPLLDGTLADRASAAVLDIARAIANGEGNPAKVTDRTLFWAYVAGAFDDGWIADAYDRAVAELVEDTPRWFGELGLYSGAACVGFTIAHVSEPGAADASLTTIDEVIADALAVEAWTRDYDLISGLAGIGVYLLERGDVASVAIDRVVDHLIATSTLEPAGRTWLTRPHLLPINQRERFPEGSYNCGLAHGMPGVLAFLGRAAERGNEKARSAGLEASRWLAAQYLPDDPAGHYPPWIDRDRRGTPAGTRSAWCYGDAGVAISTFGAARRLSQSTEPALALAREGATRSFETSSIVDAGLCHGASGLAHIYNRLFQASGDPTLRDAARTWFGNVFRLRGHPDGVAGFAANTKGLGEPPSWVPTTALLEGAIGIGLALLAAIRPDEPSWDRTLACDV